MTNYNERLDEILSKLAIDTTLADRVASIATTASSVNNASERYEWSLVDAKQAIASLIKELVAEAKPDRQPPMKMGNPTKESSDLDKMIFAKKKGHNEAIDQFEQNLLKALEEV